MSDTVRLGRIGAAAIRRAFDRYRDRFDEITLRARGRFQRRQWQEGQGDARERLGAYRKVLDGLVAELGERLGERLEDKTIWAGMHTVYDDSLGGLKDAELAKSFFNSATRRVFSTEGVDHAIEFHDVGYRTRPWDWPTKLFADAELSELTLATLEAYSFGAPYEDAERDAAAIAAQAHEAWHAEHEAPVQRLEFLEPVFYRGTAAYLVGRMRSGDDIMPLVLVLLHGEGGICVDAALTTTAEVSIVFSYTRSYFHVEVVSPSELVSFLLTLTPEKPIAELYISLGFDKHGKTELYRSFLRHLEGADERFDIAPGDRGMVMIVFSMPTYEYVFKIIRDSFPYPKTSTPADVMNRYRLVFKHDRTGRLVDAQEFEHLTFDRALFTDELLEEFAGSAAKSVTIGPDQVTVHHLYMERQVTPLNLFLREASPPAAARAVLDYGQAIRDLAATNIFPGDLLLKNFGVTGQDRVIFYDYDELCLVTDCQFRDLPTARDDAEEMSGEPWFYVGDNDIFPEEFLNFLSLTPEQRTTFLTFHDEVLSPHYWRDLQKRHFSREIIEVFPYPNSRKLRLPQEDEAAG